MEKLLPEPRNPSPEYIKGKYDSAARFSESMYRIADQADANRPGSMHPSGVEKENKRLTKIREEGDEAVATVQSEAEQYASKNGEAMQEQARIGMESDLSQRKAA